MAEKSWKAKRKGQGFSYEEVLKEMKRRVLGEYSLSKKEAEKRFKEGVQRLDRAYRLSALLNDFLDQEGMTYKDLLAFIGTDDGDCSLHILIDPVSRGEKRRSLRSDYFVHCFYPGADIPFQE